MKTRLARYQGKVLGDPFEAECPSEDAEVFKIIWVEAAYYWFPPVEYLLLKLLKTLRDGEASYQSQGQAGSSPQSSERRKPLPSQAERCGQMGKPGHYQTMHLPEMQHSRCHASPAGWLVKSGRMNMVTCPAVCVPNADYGHIPVLRRSRQARLSAQPQTKIRT